MIKYYDDAILTVLLSHTKNQWDIYRKNILLNSLSCYHIPFNVRKISKQVLKDDYNLNVNVFEKPEDRFK